MFITRFVPFQTNQERDTGGGPTVHNKRESNVENWLKRWLIIFIAMHWIFVEQWKRVRRAQYGPRSTFVNNKQHKTAAFIAVCNITTKPILSLQISYRQNLDSRDLMFTYYVPLCQHSFQPLSRIELDFCWLFCHLTPNLSGTFGVCIIIRVKWVDGCCGLVSELRKLRNAQIGVKLCKSFCLLQARWLWGVQRGMKLVKHCNDFVAPMHYVAII